MPHLNWDDLNDEFKKRLASLDPQINEVLDEEITERGKVIEEALAKSEEILSQAKRVHARSDLLLEETRQFLDALSGTRQT